MTSGCQSEIAEGLPYVQSSVRLKYHLLHWEDRDHLQFARKSDPIEFDPVYGWYNLQYFSSISQEIFRLIAFNLA